MEIFLVLDVTDFEIEFWDTLGVVLWGYGSYLNILLAAIPHHWEKGGSGLLLLRWRRSLSSWLGQGEGVLVTAGGGGAVRLTSRCALLLSQVWLQGYHGRGNLCTLGSGRTPDSLGWGQGAQGKTNNSVCPCDGLFHMSTWLGSRMPRYLEKHDLWVCLWWCFSKRLAFELVGWRNQICFPMWVGLTQTVKAGIKQKGSRRLN